MEIFCLLIVFGPLVAALLVGLWGESVGNRGAHWISNIGVAASFILSSYVFLQLSYGEEPTFNKNIYTWLEAGGIQFHIGFLVDQLTAVMMVVVTFVSWMVHIYTIGYNGG